MYDYYCKNCKNIIGKWNNEHKWFDSLTCCNYIKSKNINVLNFLDCKNCNKFVGIYCWHVCKKCFGKNEIFGETELKKWFLKNIKKLSNFSFNCEICDNNEFRDQYWYFKEFTFYNQ